MWEVQSLAHRSGGTETQLCVTHCPFSLFLKWLRWHTLLASHWEWVRACPPGAASWLGRGVDVGTSRRNWVQGHWGHQVRFSQRGSMKKEARGVRVCEEIKGHWHSRRSQRALRVMLKSLETPLPSTQKLAWSCCLPPSQMANSQVPAPLLSFQPVKGQGEKKCETCAVTGRCAPFYTLLLHFEILNKFTFEPVFGECGLMGQWSSCVHRGDTCKCAPSAELSSQCSLMPRGTKFQWTHDEREVGKASMLTRQTCWRLGSWGTDSPTGLTLH